MLAIVFCRGDKGGDDAGDDGPATYAAVRCHNYGVLKVLMWVQESWGDVETGASKQATSTWR